MTYTEKRFDEEFGDVWKIIEHTVGQLPKMERQNRQIKAFISTSNHQAEQEIEVKVRLEIFQMLHKRIMETKDLNQIDILELLQKELLDNLKE